MVQVTLFQAALFSAPSFVLEAQSQQTCKIDELVHGLLLRGQLGGGVASGDTAQQVIPTQTYQAIIDYFVL